MTDTVLHRFFKFSYGAVVYLSIRLSICLAVCPRVSLARYVQIERLNVYRLYMGLSL